MILAHRPGKRNTAPWPPENAQVSHHLNAHSNQVGAKQKKYNADKTTVSLGSFSLPRADRRKELLVQGYSAAGPQEQRRHSQHEIKVKSIKEIESKQG